MATVVGTGAEKTALMDDGHELPYFAEGETPSLRHQFMDDEMKRNLFWIILVLLCVFIIGVGFFVRGEEKCQRQTIGGTFEIGDSCSYG